MNFLFRKLDGFQDVVLDQAVKTLRDYQVVLNQALRLCAKATEFSCEPPLSHLLRENRRLIVAINHSTPLSWLPASALLVANVCARGGENRTPIGVMDRFFFQVPFFREIAGLVTQTDRALNFEEIVQRFEDQTENAKDLDLVVFPEGSNCFFGSCDELQDFRSPRFIEIAIRTRTPILVVVHRGSEAWATSITIPDSWLENLAHFPRFAREFLEKRLREKGQLVVPLWPAPMKQFSMTCELYRPSLRFDDLSEDLTLRRQQLQVEADKIHQLMKQLLLKLKSQSEPELLRETEEEQLDLFSLIAT